MVEIDNRKAALIAELEISRGEMRKAVRDCEESLDLVSHVRRSVASNLKYWLPGAALGGWVLSRLFRAGLSSSLSASLASRTGGTNTAPARSSVGGAASSAGWILAMAKIGFEVLRPQLADIASEWIARKAAGIGVARGRGNPTHPGAAANGAAANGVPPG